jgi:CRP-like cAMP-binding protein
MIKNHNSLLSSELFANLTEEELSRIAPLCSEFVAIEDALLFAEGRSASHLYVITSGRVALQKSIRVPHAKYSRRTTIAICYPGEVIGWSALVEPFTYTLSAVAWDSARLTSIDSKLLRRALDMYPDMGYKVMKTLSAVMSRRLRQITESLINEREVSLSGLKVSSLPYQAYG